MRSATPPCTSPSTPELSTMYDDDITPQYEYILQHYESQDMARAVSQDSFGSAVSVHSVGLGCATPDIMLSIPDLFQGDLSQQLQHIPVATGLDQNHMAYENSHDAYGTNFQEQTETPWTNNTVMDGGVVPYPDGLVYRGGSYGQQGVPTWDYPIQEVDGYWQQQQQQQQQQYPEMQTIEPVSTYMAELWQEEPPSQPQVQRVQPITPTEGPSSSAKQLHQCPYDGCDAVFDRSANLTRHVAKSKKHVLTNGRSGKPDVFHCGFRICQKAGRDAIPRKDHCREHLRNFHRQDLYKRGEKVEMDWLRECLIDKAYWYCNKCLARNRTADVSSAWRCSRCGNECEPERIAVRLET
ncbi:uncharacterized protein PgNI_07698 [Pyricularia grisea]|uniref:C2H2-type domain-containing protein n=1 Tax=Pyricularia grisea TaxID=148305 RepID=A0A6P8B2W0_PYRGI|nr:uncharacterized protein PgNI_07698 [Pyricularia grisea]TLD09187.1 hypothetical protein PgNI_07698 [Pyricularia grisea]